MSAEPSSSEIPLPRGWPSRVKSAILHVISLAQFSMACTRGWVANNPNSGIRLKAELERAQQEVALVKEELRIHQARMARLPPHHRPYYQPIERMAILELKAARGWSLEQTAHEFLVTVDTIRSWLKRVDEQGPKALVQLAEPVNKLPPFVRYIVQRLKTLCPMLGKVKIGQILARAGLHLGVTTVGRILKEQPVPQPAPGQPTDEKPSDGNQQQVEGQQEADRKQQVVTSKYPNHVWLIDLTTVPIGPGFWTTWPPFCLPQCWPVCWWVAVVMDHYSRRIMGTTLFLKQPTSEAVRAFLGRVIHTAEAKPKHLISDKGRQFWCGGYKEWCRENEIKPRFGAVGQSGSIAVVERLILTLKQNIAWLTMIPLRREAFLGELRVLGQWYNVHRPHMSLGGRTPEEVYEGLRPQNRQPRFEPRPAWPRCCPCARPVTLVKGQPGVRLHLEVTFLAGHRHLPMVTLKRAA